MSQIVSFTQCKMCTFTLCIFLSAHICGSGGKVKGNGALRWEAIVNTERWYCAYTAPTRGQVIIDFLSKMSLPVKSRENGSHRRESISCRASGALILYAHRGLDQGGYIDLYNLPGWTAWSTKTCACHYTGICMYQGRTQNYEIGGKDWKNNNFGEILSKYKGNWHSKFTHIDPKA